MIRNERQAINTRRVDVKDYVYKVNLETWEEGGDIECIDNAYFYTLNDAKRFALIHCNDDSVMAADIYRADGYDVAMHCRTWEDITTENFWEMIDSVYSDAYFDRED